MRSILIWLLVLCSPAAHAQETTIRVLGAYVPTPGVSSSDITAQLRNIVTAWNDSGMPTAAATTIQLLNAGAAVSVAYPNMPSSIKETLNKAYLAPQWSTMAGLRNTWKADVIILFRGPDAPVCGAAKTFFSTGQFVATFNGMDLTSQNSGFIAVVDPGCYPATAAHEFGHLLGAGHAVTQGRLYDDSRAHIRALWTTCYSTPDDCWTWHWGTAMADDTDVQNGHIETHAVQYSRNIPGYGDAGHKNVGALAKTARSVANYYQYPPEATVLRAPINVFGTSLGCGWYRITWQNDPATNVPVDHYEVWYAQPVTNPYQYGWTVVAPFTEALVSGTSARAKAKACSGFSCSAMSISSFTAIPQYCGPIEP